MEIIRKGGSDSTNCKEDRILRNWKELPDKISKLILI